MGSEKGSGGAGKSGGQTQGGDFESGAQEAEGGPELSVEAIEAARADVVGAGDGGRVDELLAEVAALRRDLVEAKGAAENAARRAEIERALASAGVIDLEITSPLVEEVVGSMEVPDIGKAVREVRSSKGFLFRQPAGTGLKSAAMAGVNGRGAGLEDLAGDARSTGDRSDLLRYLRARRG